MKPLIGITVDRIQNEQAEHGRYQTGPFIARAVAAAGGVPVLMAVDPAMAGHYAEACHGFVFTGGLDPDTTAFGEPMHPKARKLDPMRQAFETALLDALDKRDDRPVLGVCLGMQMMALHAGGKLNQYMPDTMADAQRHKNDLSHPIRITVDDSLIRPSDADDHEPICSSHQQAVSDPGRLRVIAVADDGTVEAIDGQPVHGERFYLGVQWHPERGGEGPLNLGLFRQLVSAAARTLP
ncbi:MAG: gamma-glutamyl-gamma-aminobutyrate hydrolase family protein [Planctomycetaceae bacterium]|nr:gamma-glutamyl-gamma-aminobutyrate hydrolase family protein [Planctomycetaceae bacterium]